MEGEKFYINKELLPADEAEKERIEKSKQDVRVIVENFKKATEDQEIPFSPEMVEYIQEAKRWHEERYRSLGIEEVKWGQDIVKISSIRTENNGHGVSGFGVVKIADLSKEQLIPIPDDQVGKTSEFLPIRLDDESILAGMGKEEAAKKLRDYLEAVYISHELYHDASPTSVFVRTIEDKETGEKRHAAFGNPFDRSGMHYIRQKQEGGPPALEEGLAMTIQEQSASLAAEKFPEGAALYDRLLDYTIQKDPRLQNAPKFILSIRNFDGENVKYGPIQYMDGYVFTAYLAREIPDFFQLVEKARIEGETVSLARVIEKRFGTGSYRKIVTCTEEKALDLMHEFQEQDKKH